MEHKSHIFEEFMKKAIENDIDVKIDGENKSIKELNKEAQEFFLSNTMDFIKKESNEIDKSSGLRMFKTKDGGTATFCFHFR